MKITRVEAVSPGISPERPLLVVGREYAFAEMVLGRLETSGHDVDFGEAPVAPCLTGVLTTVEMLSQAVMGTGARNIVELTDRMHCTIVVNAAATAAVDVALHDDGLPVL